MIITAEKILRKANPLASSCIDGERKPTGSGDVGQVLDGAGQRENQTDDERDDTEHDGAGTVVGNGVHHDSEGDNVATHDEDREEDLAQTEQLPAKSAHEDLSRIGKVVDVGVAFTELTNDITSVKGEDTETDDENERTAPVSRSAEASRR